MSAGLFNSRADIIQINYDKRQSKSNIASKLERLIVSNFEPESYQNLRIQLKVS